MADTKRLFASVVIGALLVALNLVAFNYLLASWSGARLDLTSEGVFSISPATRRILSNLDEELTILGYFSGRTHPKLAPLVPEIEDLLEEYRAVSKGRVHIEITDPSKDEDAEEEAADRYGVSSNPFRLATKYESAIVNAYFALVVKYGDQYVRYGVGDLIAVEATADGDIDVRLRNLEYDLTRAIKKVVYGFRSTNELFERVEDPVKLSVIWTPNSLPEMFSATPDAVRKAAAELEEAGGDKFEMEEIDPTDNQALQQELYQRYGARPMSVGLFGGEEFYLYGILQTSGGRSELVPLTGESVTAASIRESIENSLRRSTPGFLKTVGIVAPAPLDIPPELRMQMQMPPQPPPEFEEIKRLLGEEYQVREVTLDESEGVPSEVDILLVLEPKDMGETQVFNLDQYLMRGGRVVLCTGNYDVDFSPRGLSLSPMDSGLDAWLQHQGVTVDTTLVLDDRNQALPIPEIRNTPFGQVRTWKLAPYPYLVQVQSDGFRSPEITATLDAVGIYWGSPLTIDPERTKASGLEVIPILQSSERSWTSDDADAVTYVDYQVPAETEPYLLAAAISGRFKSFFAEKGAPAAGVPPSGPDETVTPPSTVTLKESPDTRLVVVGNSEFLNDFVARALGQVDGGFFDENLRFIQNVIDWVGLDNDMLSIRARGMTSRRLERVEESAQVLVETVNYALPVFLLIAVALFLRWRRRQTLPLVAGAGRSLPVESVSSGEV